MLRQQSGPLGLVVRRLVAGAVDHRGRRDRLLGLRTAHVLLRLLRAAVQGELVAKDVLDGLLLVQILDLIYDRRAGVVAERGRIGGAGVLVHLA